GVPADRMAQLANLVATGAINATTAVTVSAKMLESGRTPQEIVESEGMLQVRDTDAMEKWVNEALAANPKAIADAKGNPKKAQAAIGFLRGQVMKLSAGKADPKLVGELLQKRLGS